MANKVNLIEEIKLDVGEGGLACGPIGGPIVAACKVKYENNKIEWFYDVVVEGIHCICKTKDDEFDKILSNDLTDDECNNMELDEFDGIDLHDESDLYLKLSQNKKNHANLIKLLIYLANCFFNEVEYDKNIIGKDVNDLKFNVEVDDYNISVELM